MPRVRMFHPASDRYQDGSLAGFEQEYQRDGWILAGDEPMKPSPDAPEPEVVDEAPADEPATEPTTPKRARRS